MFSLEKICKKISDDIGNELEFDFEKKAVINYGIFAVIQILISLIFVMLLGILFNVVIEALIILFTISVLRQSSGGVHASSPSTCTIIGTIVSVGMAIVIKNSSITLIGIVFYGALIFIWSYFIIYKLAPVDSPAKPIKNKAKIKRLKKSSILILSVYLIFIILNIIGYCLTKKVELLVYSGCIYIGLLWQIFSLTKSGHVVLGKIDALFK